MGFYGSNDPTNSVKARKEQFDYTQTYNVTASDME